MKLLTIHLLSTMFPSKKSFSANFQCRACGHEFRRNLPRVYIHMPDFDRQIAKKQPGGHSPFVIPQHMSCPVCNVMDECDLTPSAVSTLTLTVIASSLSGGLAKGHPVKLISFALHDGTVIHPLDALEHYRMRLENAPDDVASRMRYANVLRTLGWIDEAKEQYLQLQKSSPHLLEAWMGMASLFVATKHLREAKKMLAEIVKRAPSSADMDWEAYLQDAQGYLSGSYPMSDLLPESIFLRNEIKPKPARKKRA